MNEARYRSAEEALWKWARDEPTERFVDLAGVGTRVRVLTVGSGPPALFLHGATNGASSWATLAARLPRMTCHLLDRPGCGLSEPLPGRLRDPDELATYADALVVEVLDALDLATASLVGTSFGGYFAMRAAAAHPDRIDRVVELSWLFGAPVEKVAPMMRVAGIQSLGKVMSRVPPSKSAVRSLLRQIGLRRAVDSGRFGPELMDWFQALLRDTDTMRNELDSAPPVVRPIRGIEERVLLSDELLAGIASPTHFIWGAEDPQGGRATAEAFTARIPGATLEVMDHAGHAPWIDDPDHVASVVGRFLVST